MTAAAGPLHLAERAVQAMGRLDGFGVLAEALQPRPGPAPAKPARASSPDEPPAALPDAAASVIRMPPPPPLRSVGLDVLQRAGLVAMPGEERNRVGEELGVVQHQVLRSVGTEGRGRIVLVTSARPGEGKSFTSLNLAAALAAGGRHVLLVDIDGKRGSLSELLGLHDATGLRALAIDPRLPPRGLVVPTALEHLVVVPHGRALGENQAATPPGAALSAATQALADAMPDHIIVLDTPPCLCTSDPSTLASIAGQVVMVVEAQRTSRQELETALDMVDACPLLQLVLNRVRLSTGSTFGSYAGAYAGGYPGG